MKQDSICSDAAVLASYLLNILISEKIERFFEAVGILLLVEIVQEQLLWVLPRIYSRVLVQEVVLSDVVRTVGQGIPIFVGGYRHLLGALLVDQLLQSGLQLQV